MPTSWKRTHVMNMQICDTTSTIAHISSVSLLVFLPLSYASGKRLIKRHLQPNDSEHLKILSLRYTQHTLARYDTASVLMASFGFKDEKLLFQNYKCLPIWRQLLQDDTDSDEEDAVPIGSRKRKSTGVIERPEQKGSKATKGRHRLSVASWDWKAVSGPIACRYVQLQRISVSMFVISPQKSTL